MPRAAKAAVDDIDAAFADLGSTYPGSKRTRKSIERIDAPPPDASMQGRWDAAPHIKRVDGKNVEFFFIGALAQALERSPNTIRRWIEHGTIPQARFRIDAVSIKGSRRMWTRAQIEGMIRIAREEGLFEGRNVGGTQFTARVKELQRVLKKAGKL